MNVPTHVAVSATADTFPPEANHRYADPGGPSCATCSFFSRGVCTQWQAPTGQAQVCDQYQPLHAGGMARSSRYSDQMKQSLASSDASGNIPAKP